MIDEQHLRVGVGSVGFLIGFLTNNGNWLSLGSGQAHRGKAADN